MDYWYRECGLDNVILRGIQVLLCPVHGEMPIFPQIGRLHSLIADTLGRKKNRSSQEEKFLARVDDRASAGGWARVISSPNVLIFSWRTPPPSLKKDVLGECRNDETKKYAFCESAWAGSRTPWHIRQLTDAGRKPGGGADTKALCGCEVAWDLTAEVNLSFDRCCRKCAEAYAAEWLEPGAPPAGDTAAETLPATKSPKEE